MTDPTVDPQTKAYMADIRRIALVTGAAGGIGRELARELAALGYDVVGVDRNGGELETLAAELKGRFPKMVYIAIETDLARPDAAETLHAACREKDLHIDVLVNNVGFGKMGEHVLQSLSVMTDMLALNTLLTTKLCLLFGAEMKERGRGHILNVASLVGFSSSPFFSAYSGTKAYVIAFSVGLARELAPYGVGVTCLCPGTTATGFLDTASIDHPSSVAMRRFASAFVATPDVVAKAGIAGLFKGKLIVVPTTFLRLQAAFLRTMPIELVSGFVHRKIVSISLHGA